MARAIVEANLDDYEDVKKVDKTQSYYDDYSVYSYLDSSVQESTSVRRSKSTNFVRSQHGSGTADSVGSRFIKAKTHAVEADSSPDPLAKKLDDSIPVNGSLDTFDKPKGKGDNGSQEELRDASKPLLGVINEVNERDFDTKNAENTLDLLGGGAVSRKKHSDAQAEEPNFL